MAEVSRESPVVQLRARLGLGQAEFARALGLSLPAVCGAENGRTAKPLALFRALSLVGYDTATLADDYARWYAELVEARRLRLRSRIDAVSMALNALVEPESNLRQVR